jgi:hypothetical protein
MSDPSIQKTLNSDQVSIRERKYWGFRTDHDFQSDLFEELKAGRLRQGWGGGKSQDLRVIKQIIEKGGNWWERLSNNQNEAYPHYRMLGIGEDSIHLGDIWLEKLQRYKRSLIAELL